MNIASLLKGEEPTEVGTWNAVCLADFGDSGVAFVAQPQIPPRNVNWSSSGKWVHYAKIGFEKYFLRKIRHGQIRAVLRAPRASGAGHRQAQIHPCRNRRTLMTVNQAVTAFAGFMVLLSLALTWSVSPYFLA